MYHPTMLAVFGQQYCVRLHEALRIQDPHENLMHHCLSSVMEYIYHSKEVPLIFVRRNYGSLIRNTPSTGGFFQLTASAGEMLRGGRRRPKPRAAKPRSGERVTIKTCLVPPG